VPILDKAADQRTPSEGTGRLSRHFVCLKLHVTTCPRITSSGAFFINQSSSGPIADRAILQTASCSRPAHLISSGNGKKYWVNLLTQNG
jgi:hypothetical protein